MDPNSPDEPNLNNINNIHYTDKKFLLVKIPANVENTSKAIELLGGKEEIYNNFLSDEDIEMKYFYKDIALEKCLSNDLILKRKRMRNKTKYIVYYITIQSK